MSGGAFRIGQCLKNLEFVDVTSMPDPLAPQTEFGHHRCVFLPTVDIS